jgi:hypothetical protein
MKRLTEFALEDGNTVLIEVEDPFLEDTVPAARGEVAEKARESFEHAVGKILPVAKSVVEQLRKLPSPGAPNEIEVAFGFNMSAEASAIIATTSAAANFSVLLRWNNTGKEAQ